MGSAPLDPVDAHRRRMALLAEEVSDRALLGSSYLQREVGGTYHGRCILLSLRAQLCAGAKGHLALAHHRPDSPMIAGVLPGTRAGGGDQRQESHHPHTVHAVQCDSAPQKTVTIRKSILNEGLTGAVDVEGPVGPASSLRTRPVPGDGKDNPRVASVP